MNNELKQVLVAALNGSAITNFSAQDTEKAAVAAIMKECGLTETSTAREIRAKEDLAFALIEEAVDEILPAKIQDLMGGFAEVRTFPRDAEVVFNIEKIGKNRAKLTISRGARSGIYRAARLDSKQFSLSTHVETVAVFVTLEEIILGTMSIGELYNNILEGFQEAIYKEVFNELATGTPVAGYERIEKDSSASTTLATIGATIDKVIPYVKQYGPATIFGSYEVLSTLWNDAATDHPELLDSADKRNKGVISVYKGTPVVVLPNYLVDNGNEDWFYDPKYVFVLPAGARPVKVALKGELYIQRNTAAVGSEKWEAHKMIGVGLAMANNYAVIEVNDLD